MNQPLCYKLKELQKALLNPPPPQQLEESTPTLPPTPSKINLAPEDTDALMMMTRTALTNLNTSDMKQKCYHWAIRVKTYADGLTDEFDNVYRLQAQDIYTLSKLHLASLALKMHIEAEIVSAMCFIINQQNIQRFQEEVYCLPPDIVNMALANHPEGVFLQTKNNKPFRVEDYPIYNCAIYVMKWLEIFEPANIKRQKYEWDDWNQDEVDHFRVEYASRILFHDMNLDKAEAIRGSNVIRLSKPSSLLLSPYCHIDSEDVDTA
ncbi:uncharacterized protein DS421_16g541140 [Arachis hypogaea]|nr:uncharacterized protein DS421_16g541140 [Arachis hypogaea]